MEGKVVLVLYIIVEYEDIGIYYDVYVGEDVYVPVPPGTIVRDHNGLLAGELNRNGDVLLVARGGRGGRGVSVTLYTHYEALL